MSDIDKMKELLYEFGYESWNCGLQKIEYNPAEDIPILAKEIADLQNGWISVESAPKDGSKFIGLYPNRKVFTTWWQAYNNYTKNKDGGHSVSSHRHEWTYDEGDSIVPSRKLIAWQPLPEPPTKPQTS